VITAILVIEYARARGSTDDRGDQGIGGVVRDRDGNKVCEPGQLGARLAVVCAVRILGDWAGAAYIFFAYIGFDAVSTTAQEAKNPQRDLPIGIITSLVACTSCTSWSRVF